jgi:hypothetical protein
LAVNPVTNKIYLSNFTDNTISVIDGASNTLALSGTSSAPATITAGTRPGSSVVNPITNRTYVTNFNSGNLTVITEQNVHAIPLTTAISPLPNNQSISPMPSFTFTTSSTYAPTAPTPQNVYFQLDTWQGPWLAASGSAPSFTAATPLLSFGPHIIYAYATDGQNADSEGSGIIGQIQAYFFIVTQAGTSTTLISSANPSGAGQSITFTASVTVTPPGSGTPTGTVTFTDGATTLGTGTLSAGQATFATSSLVQGSHSITAVYGGDAKFGGSTSAPLNQTVLVATTTNVISSANPSVPNQSVTFTATVSASSGTPTGTVTFKDGSNALGTAMLAGSQATFSTSALGPGSHSITAVYGGDANFAGSTSPALNQVVVSATTTSVVSSANPSIVTQSVTFTATVSVVPPGSGMPTGTMTFKDGTSVLGTGTLSSGQATFTTSLLTAGSHSITAVYGGSANFQASTSAALNQTVTSQPPDFSVASNSTSASVVAGQSVNVSLTITPTNGFASSISFACSGQPVGVSCSFNPQTVTPVGNGTPVTTVLTISTTTSVASLGSRSTPGHAPSPVHGLWLLSGIAGLVLASTHRPRQNKGRRSSLLMAPMLCLLLAALAGCGGRAQPPGPVTANIVVTASSGGVSHTTNLTLTITH